MRDGCVSSVLCIGFYTLAAATVAAASSGVLVEGSRGVYTYRVSLTEVSLNVLPI